MSNHSDEGFYARKGGKTTYIQVRKDQFVETVPEGTEGAVSRENKRGNIVWEIFHDGGFKGQLRGVYFPKPGEFGMQCCFRFKTKTIQVPCSSSHFKKFARVCANIDLTEPVIIVPYNMPKKDIKTGKVIPDKYITGWNIYQGGDEKENKLEDTIDASKDGPVPALVKKKVKGKDVWDDSDQIEFYVERINEWIDSNSDYFDQFKSARDEHSDEDDDDEEDEDEEEEDEPRPKKKTKKPSKEEDEEDEDDDDNVPY